MPALIAHHLFGQEVLGGWLPAPTPGDALRAATSTVDRAFLLGCQGPDPFFFTVFSPELVKNRHFGTLMHEKLVIDSFDFMRRAINGAPAAHQQSLEAYALGWLCHFVLDSSAHPFIFYLERLYCQAGVPGLDHTAHAEVHAQIESELDASMLLRRAGRTIKNWRPMSETLLLDATTTRQISAMYSRLAAEVYNVSLADNAFARGARDMRTSYDVLYSPNGTRRALLGRLERLVRPHSLAQATSHRADIGEYSAFDNQEHDIWINPFTGAPGQASFDDIFSDAVTDAIRRLNLYAAGATSKDIIGLLNFSGSVIEHM